MTLYGNDPVPDYDYSRDYPGKGLNKLKNEVSTDETQNQPKTLSSKTEEQEKGIFGLGLKKIQAITAPYTAPMLEKVQRVYTSAKEHPFVQEAKKAIDKTVKVFDHVKQVSAPVVSKVIEKGKEACNTLEQFYRKQRYKKLQALPQETSKDLLVALSMSELLPRKQNGLDNFTVVVPEDGLFLDRNLLRIEKILNKLHEKVLVIEYRISEIPSLLKKFDEIEGYLIQQKEVEKNSQRKEAIDDGIALTQNLRQVVRSFVEHHGIDLKK